ncbi:hypothetical protein OMAG_002649 [Candidatus Omnitrophus magneticus]|uniref:Uncharacterized protein n=1 Tax=Candidatus Omnitrophus magneticus TaxID=1609969 RepID=A0A0F0CJI5_9BACT|nr:hypothetical protein OMAG_002649 [Candidatus Omnitrophus magneticus]
MYSSYILSVSFSIGSRHIIHRLGTLALTPSSDNCLSIAFVIASLNENAPLILSFIITTGIFRL